MLDIKNLTVSVGSKTIIKDFSCHFEKGKVYAIMGPNGSGKSTLARSIIGDKSFNIHGKILLNNKNIIGLPVERIAQLGIHLCFQNPPAIDGVSIYHLFFSLFGGKENILDIKDKIDRIAKLLKIKQELLDRSINLSFSGGEKKKLEVLQVLLIDSTITIFDEIDSGVDIDSLKTILNSLRQLRKKEKTLIFISHYQKIFEYVSPDFVLIMRDGKINKVGNKSLIKKVEKEGYQ